MVSFRLNFTFARRVLRKIFRWLGVLLVIWLSPVIACFIYFSFFYIKAFLPRDMPNDIPYVACGKINGVSFKFPEGYIPHFLEHGVSELSTKDFVKRRRACQANISSVNLAMTWPDLKPAGADYIKTYPKFSGVAIRLVPTPISDSRYLRHRLEVDLEDGYEKTENNAVYFSALNL